MDTQWLMAMVTGVVCGVIFAAPVGPMGLLAFLKIAEGRVREGWLLGLGSCVGEGLTAMLAAYGALKARLWLERVVESELLHVWPGARAALVWVTRPEVLWLTLAVLLSGLAYAVWRKRHAPLEAHRGDAGGSWRALGLSLVATVLHPGNLAVFTVVFVWVNHHYGLALNGPYVHLLLAAGVVLGAGAIWAAALVLVQRNIQRLHLDVWTVRLRYMLIVVLMLSAGAAVVEAARAVLRAA